MTARNDRTFRHYERRPAARGLELAVQHADEVRELRDEEDPAEILERARRRVEEAMGLSELRLERRHHA